MDFSKYTVLIVDDVPSNVLLLKIMLEQAGLQVISADGSEEALKKLETENVDLILLDVLMPKMNGFELAQQLKTTTVYKDIPIIFLTALNSTSDIIKGFELGAADYVSKPFNKEELMVRIHHQLSLLEAVRTIKQQSEELKQTIAGRDKLYSVIAHDLRAPISSIKTGLNVLTLKMESEKKDRPELIEMVHSLDELAEQTFTLFDNLLKWTRSQTGTLEAVPQTINLSELAEGVIEISSFVAAIKHITLHFESPEPEKTEVFVDIDMIKSAIRNLLSNAIKFSYNNSEINAAVIPNGDIVTFTVTDKGCGISEEVQKKLLDAGTHYTTYGTSHEPGSGLGLLLVNEYMKLNGGRLFFHSKKGEGSTFGFTLPVYHK